jgi:hypothetical protein
MEAMTLISAEATAARETARVASGKFGEQQHSAPDLSIEATATATPAELNDLWDARQTAAREMEAANINRAIAHMPENIRGLRFIDRHGELILALVIPSTPGGHIAGADFHEKYRPVLAAYANNRSDYLELEPVTEASGRPAWEWIPSAEQRAIPAAFADTAREDAVLRFREASADFTERSADYLRSHLPEGVERLEIAYAPVKNGKTYDREATVIAAYDADGEHADVDYFGREFAMYRVNVARTDIHTVFPSQVNETGGTTYTISREA